VIQTRSQPIAVRAHHVQQSNVFGTLTRRVKTALLPGFSDLDFVGFSEQIRGTAKRFVELAFAAIRPDSA
jgi:hypothetical protein